MRKKKRDNKIKLKKKIILPQYCSDTKDGWWLTCLNGCNGQMEAVHTADCPCYHSNLPGWRTNMDPSPDTWTRTQRGFGPVLYQQLWCSSRSHCEQENWWRQTHYLAYVLCLIKKWRWPIKIVLAYTFFKTWCRYQENRAEMNASITATKERWYLLKSAQHSPIQPKKENWHINREKRGLWISLQNRR